MLKTAFLGTPPFAATCLEALSQQGLAPALVFTQPSKARGRGQKVQKTAVAEAADQAGIPWEEAEDINSEAPMEKLRALAPDLVLVVAFGQLLKKPLLELPRIACLNVHGSLLPKYRGAAPIQWAIWNGDTETGVSIQRMVRKMDAGDVLLTKKIAITPTMTSGSLFEQMAPLGAEALVEAVRRAQAGPLEFTPQDPDQVTFAPKLTKDQAPLDWTQAATQLHNQVRALNPWPTARLRMGDEPLRVHQTELVGPLPGAPGQVHTDHQSFLHVSCGDGEGLSLTWVQQENRKRLSIEDFLKGFRGTFPHSNFGSEL